MKEQTALARQEKAFKTPETTHQFTELLGKRAQHFISSILGLLAENEKLAACSSQSILRAAMKGAALDLSFDTALGEAYMLPFKNKAVFVPGYKGLTQLCIRTGQFAALGSKGITSKALTKIQSLILSAQNPTESVIRFLEMIDFFPEFQEGKIEGFCSYLRLTNGYQKYLYWTKKQCLTHAQKYAPTWDKTRQQFRANSAWLSHEDTMCCKTVYRQLILSDAPKSKELQIAFESETEADREYTESLQTSQMISTGTCSKNIDDELFGEEPQTKIDTELQNRLENGYIKIRQLWDENLVHPLHKKASIKKHLQVETLEECQDIDKLLKYYMYQKEKYAKPDPRIEEINGWIEVIKSETSEQKIMQRCEQFEDDVKTGLLTSERLDEYYMEFSQLVSQI